MKNKKTRILEHIDFWLVTVLDYLDKHKVQARIFWSGLTLAMICWSIIISFYLGWVIQQIILNYRCR